MKTSRADILYRQLREMAVDFRLKPGESLNEVELSETLKASRTPLREALNRLVAEGLMEFVPGKGFFSRRLSILEITELYDVRVALEVHAVKLASKRADRIALENLRGFLLKTSEQGRWSQEEVLSFDEHFHETLAVLSGNGELLKMLKMTNARIRFFRWVDMGKRRDVTQLEHMQILDAIALGKTGRACSLMQSHITRRADQISAAVNECHDRLFGREDYVKPAFLEEVTL